MRNPESIPGDYDEVTRLRLQLSHAEMQRDAYANALKGDVLRIAKTAIYQAAIDAGKAADADTIGCMGVELDDLRKENARLKEENTLLRMRAIDDPLIREAVASAVLAQKGGRP